MWPGPMERDAQYMENSYQILKTSTKWNNVEYLYFYLDYILESYFAYTGLNVLLKLILQISFYFFKLKTWSLEI